MYRLPPAAKQLVKQVTEIDPDVVVTRSDPDAFGNARTVRFSGAGWLTEALQVIADSRVADVFNDQDGDAVVRFVGTTKADYKHPFPLGVVKTILSEEKVADEKADEKPEGDTPAEENPKPAKKAAKRTAKKA